MRPFDGSASLEIQRIGRELGFDRVGFVPLAPSGREAELRRWLDRGYHAGMAWLERRVEIRSDPRGLLEGARSAVCVTARYWPLSGEVGGENDLWEGVARYARGDDYHDVMKPRLLELGRRIEAAFPGHRTRSYVDTGPILERDLAERAGLGVTGKNTNLLHPEDGSWVLLGEVLTTLDVGDWGSSEGFEDLCGSCSACLDECPTGALVAPYELDANRCISYWTIEHRGPFPPSVRSSMGQWVFGCDICQEVCPVNSSVDPAPRSAWRGLPERRRELDLRALLGISREDYVERFRRSPMKRAKREGLRRNAAVAMGNRRRSSDVPALGEVLADSREDEILRGHAAWALGRIGGPEAETLLTSTRRSEIPPELALEIDSALASIS